ncbi:MAG: lytic transglycosylase domain-containing protein [Alphaproteobacteria bacterium]|nr:lytic transglycosylase domain-containing protein [Alphaproteobacteria bacterium]MCB9974386.1 lytic transglycosylase domain-containing protein [Rhodospirillales bacterium]
MQAQHLWKQSIVAAICAVLAANVFLPERMTSEGGIPVPGTKPAMSFASIRLDMEDFESLPEIKKTVHNEIAVKPNHLQNFSETEKPSLLVEAAFESAHGFLSINNTPLNILKPTEKPDDQGAYKPLSSENAALYRDIFRLQAFGRIKSADRKIAKLSDKRLLSHVLYQRYMHPVAYRSSYEELRAWLKSYPDHPEADRIEKLALSRKPEGVKPDWTSLEKRRELPNMFEPLIARAKRHNAVERTQEQQDSVKSLTSKVESLISEGEPSLAMETLFTGEGVQYMDNVERDMLRAQAALRFLHTGHTARARDLAIEAVKSSGEKVPLASWIAGLSFWKEKNYAAAAENFARAGASPYSSGWMSSAGSYWAARSYGSLKNRAQADKWYARAAQQDRTFYGLLATQALGRKPSFDWRTPPYAYKDEKKLLETPEGRRAAALVAAGQYELAESELLHYDYKKNPEMRPIALAYAAHVGLPTLAVRLGSRMDYRSEGKKRPYDSTLYPLMPWEPRRGFSVDPALIHAIVRQESRFNPQAQSYSGASGLMQIMPATARHILRGVNVADADIPALLKRPADNLTLGQSYLRELLADRNVNGDVLSMLVAYNAGPGNLARWKKRYGEIEDPLMFVEMIPVAETRNYVKRVMAFYWIYSQRGGPGAKTLEALASGKPARYAALTESTASSNAFKLAANQ